MKSKKNVSILIGIILLSITSVYPTDLKNENLNSFYENYILNWQNKELFNTARFWNKKVAVNTPKTILKVTENIVTDICTDGAIVGTVTANDIDGDGINNVCDLDDDNDGILDTEEGCGDVTSTFPNATKGYLFQKNPTQVFTIDLKTGVTTKIHTFSSTYNAVAINEMDNLFWVYNTKTSKVELINPTTFAVEETLPNTLNQKNINSGAFDIVKKQYVIISSNGNKVFVFDGDPNSPNYKTLVKSFSGPGKNIPDIAYNSNDGNFYGIRGKSKNLYKIDVDNELSTLLGAVNNLPSDNYGAAYATLNGKLYLSNNTTGVIYLVDLNDSSLNATFFSNSTASSSNDGAKVLNIDLSGNQICLDTDGDGIPNSQDLDSDGDGCLDVVESGGIDANGDGILDGTGYDSEGRVTGNTGGYDRSNGAELTALQLSVLNAPSNKLINENDAATFTVEASAEEATSYANGTPAFGTDGNANIGIVYKWYLGDPNNGGTLLSDSGVYTGTNTASLKISNVNGLDASKYYVVVTHNNNVCLIESSSATLSVNLLPTAVADNYTTNEDTSTTLTPLTTGTSDSDPEGSALTITSINGVTLTGVAQTIPVTNGNVIIDAVGTITFTPSNNYYGTVSFPYTISDDNSGTDSALITIVIDAVNDLPNAANDTATVDENSTNNNIDVLDNDDFGGDGPNTGAITLSSGTTNNNGTVSVNNNDTPNDPTDDTLTYTPASNFSGADTFKYTITDSNGDTKNATVTITVEEVSNVENCKETSPTEPALGFNVFTLESLKLKTNETEGSVATGGDLTILGSYQIATNEVGTFEVDNTPIGLLVGGKIIYTSGNSLQVNQNSYIKIGDNQGSTVWYKDQNNAYSNIRITPSSDYNSSPRILLQANSNSLNVSSSNNPVFESNLIDFASAFQALELNSTSISKNDHNAQLTNPNGQSISNTSLPNQVKINLQDGINYLNVKGTDLNNVDVFTYNNTPSATRVLVINVNASGTFNWNVWNQSGVSQQNAPYIIYNFYNTTTLNIEGNSTIEGTVFAPFADINKTANQSNIEGQVIGKSFLHAGGEVHSANFEPAIKTCSPATGIAPTAEFTVNDTNQCFESNEFVLNNTSNTGTTVQPSDPITYNWTLGDGTSSTLMNPSKTYTASGTYTITLVATNTYGTDTTTQQVTVKNPIDLPILTEATLASGSGTVTKEFTLDNDTYFDTYSWKLVNVGSNLYPNEKVVTFDFTAEGSYTLTLTGIKDDCPQSLNYEVVIASGEVSGGNDGGTESESLGDAISKIYVKRKMNSEPTIFVKSEKNLYNKEKLKSEQPYQGKGQTLLDMFPTELVAGNVSNVTSPTDILDYTVADEVLSVDFSVDGKTKGVVLGIKTTDKIYNHTKASCDRLRGAEILNIQTVKLDGYNFLMQGIKQRSGVVEYAISFVVAKNTGDANYTLQTNWYISGYTKFNDVYNFQVWSTNYEDTQKLVKDILTNLKSNSPVTQTETQKVPKTFATKIYREKSDLFIDLQSIKAGLSTEISMIENYSETSEELKYRYNPLNTELKQTLKVNIDDRYEYEGTIKVAGEVQDEFYHADGNWGLDYDSQYTEIEEYSVTNNADRIYNDEEYTINRNVEIKAFSEYDYLNIYKSLLPGNIPADYSEYKYLSFTAKGSGLIELGLIKSSVEEWKEQYRVMVDLSDEEQTYFVPFDLFSSTGTTDKITADDLTTLTFTFLAIEANTNDLDLKISDVKFTKNSVLSQTVEKIEVLNNNFITYPNPSKGNVNVLLYSNTSTEATVTLYDITGKEIYKAPTKLTAGKNELEFNIKVKPGIMYLKVNSKVTNYGTSKIIFR